MSSNFGEINYRLLEDSSEEDISKIGISTTETNIDNSLYQSAIDTNQISMNIEALNIDSAQLQRDSEELQNSKRRKSRSKDAFLNTTVYKRKEPENHNNKFVEPETLNSYLTIADLQQNATDNVHILRSNLQKMDHREEHLNDINTKTQNLMEGSTKFKKNTHLLKYKMFWIYLLNYVVAIFLIFIIIFLIIKLS